LTNKTVDVFGTQCRMMRLPKHLRICSTVWESSRGQTAVGLILNVLVFGIISWAGQVNTETDNATALRYIFRLFSLIDAVIMMTNYLELWTGDTHISTQLLPPFLVDRIRKFHFRRKPKPKLNVL